MYKDNRQKEQVLRNIREALIERNDIRDCEAHTAGSPFIGSNVDDICLLFAEKFSSAGRTLQYCYNESDIQKHILEIQHKHGNATIRCASENLYGYLGHLNVENRVISDRAQEQAQKQGLSAATLGATLCEALIAWQGSIVISSNLGLGTAMPALPENTIVIAFTSQIVADWETANERIKQLYPKYPDQIMVTHPASYAYRKGQQKLYLILIEDEQ